LGTVPWSKRGNSGEDARIAAKDCDLINTVKCRCEAQRFEPNVLGAHAVSALFSSL